MSAGQLPQGAHLYTQLAAGIEPTVFDFRVQVVNQSEPLCSSIGVWKFDPFFQYNIILHYNMLYDKINSLSEIKDIRALCPFCYNNNLFFS